jgi:hypothetical protein
MKGPPGSEMIEKSGYRSEYARTWLIQHFLTQTTHEHLFFCDSDMRPEGDTVYRLLEAQKEVVSALYFYRARPAYPCIRKDYDAWTIKQWPSEPFLDFPKDALFKVGGVGFGALLLHRDVFTKALPLFKVLGLGWGLGDQLPWAYYGCYRGIVAGGDFVFADILKLAGIELWCDSSVFVPHLTADYITLDEYDPEKARKSIEEGKRG